MEDRHRKRRALVRPRFVDDAFPTRRYGSHPPARRDNGSSRLGLQIQIAHANTSREINTAFATFARERPDALFFAGDGLFTNRRVQLVNLASHLAVPAAFGSREIAEAGGLMSYGSNVADAWRQVGTYTGRILRGANPAELPVVQSSKFELVINLQTARMLGIVVPAALLSRAEEVIE